MGSGASWEALHRRCEELATDEHAIGALLFTLTYSLRAPEPPENAASLIGSTLRRVCELAFEIWQDKAKFEAAAKALQTATGELVSLAESGDLAAVGAQLQKVGQACGGCHKPFRKKKE